MTSEQATTITDGVIFLSQSINALGWLIFGMGMAIGILLMLLLAVTITGVIAK